MKWISQILVCMVAVGLSAVSAFSKGPPIKSCAEMFPTKHKADAQTSTPIVNIKLRDAQGNDTTSYQAGDHITVTVSTVDSKNSEMYFKGLFVQARRANCSSDKKSEPVGTFTIDSNSTFLKTMDCGQISKSAVAHKVSEKHTTQTFTWIAPSSKVGHVYIQATIVKNVKTFWTGVTSSFLKDSDDKSEPQFCHVRKKNAANVTTPAVADVTTPAVADVTTPAVADVRTPAVVVVVLGLCISMANFISFS
ncbi:putative defense protein Hdd11 isoform X1 [Gigantopelta aegis]|uniref:putative defense protein Hdd11 isoform X1 n=1 Tax=Gigantopelta aegis TaxID=1735272 RepID=UPI001B88BC48|nr:putative defense protein Hdd11 isoform X1 [Gigantopelta aegis]